MFLPPATKFGQGSIFISVCQEFCPQLVAAAETRTVGKRAVRNPTGMLSCDDYICERFLDYGVEVATKTGIMLDATYTLKSTRGLVSEMQNNPGRFKGKRILYIHTGNILIFVVCI